MTAIQGQCAACGGYYRRTSDGLVPDHLHRETGETCPGGRPLVDSSSYTVGYDSDPWVMSGGLPTLGRYR